MEVSQDVRSSKLNWVQANLLPQSNTLHSSLQIIITFWSFLLFHEQIWLSKNSISEESSIFSERSLNLQELFLIPASSCHTYILPAVFKSFISDEPSILTLLIYYHNQLPTLFTRTEPGYRDRKTCKTGNLPITGTSQGFLKRLTYSSKHSLTALTIYWCEHLERANNL